MWKSLWTSKRHPDWISEGSYRIRTEESMAVKWHILQ